MEKPSPSPRTLACYMEGGRSWSLVGGTGDGRERLLGPRLQAQCGWHPGPGAGSLEAGAGRCPPSVSLPGTAAQPRLYLAQLCPS